MSYDAFLSYSHARDHQLAIALQRGLQRLAKPWYRLRALRIFRDEESLSATPALWRSIQTALDQSRYLIVIASPLAAASPWVEKEIRHFRETRSADRIILLLSDGEDAQRADFDWSRTNAVPASLASVFDAEPLYIDARFARELPAPDARHSEFRRVLTQIAAPLRGRAPDDLESDDIRLHRSAVRLASFAAAALAILATATTISSILAQRAAQRAADRERVAIARRLAVEATVAAVIDGKPDLSSLLALESLHLDTSRSGYRSLLTNLWQMQQAQYILRGSDTGILGVEFSRDGARVIGVDEKDRVLEWSLAPPATRSPATREHRTIGPAHVLAEGQAITPLAGDLAAIADDAEIVAVLNDDRIELQRLDTGEKVAALPDPDGRISCLALSADGKHLAVGTHDGSIRLWSSAAQRWTEAVSAHERDADTDDGVLALAFSHDGLLLASAGADQRVALWDASSGEVVQQTVEQLGAYVHRLRFSSGGDWLAGAGRQTYVWSLRSHTGVVYRGHVGVIHDVAFSPDGTKLASAGADGAIILWSLGDTDAPSRSWRGSSSPITSVAWSLDGSAFLSLDHDGVLLRWRSTQVPARASSWQLPRKRGANALLSRDARWLLAWNERHLELWDVAQDSPRIQSSADFADEVFTVGADDQAVTVAASSFAKDLTIFRRTGDRLEFISREILDEAADELAVAPSGQQVAASIANRFMVWDVGRTAKREAKPLSSRIRALAFDRSGSLVATATEDQTIRLWRTSDLSPWGRPLLGDAEAGPIAVAFSDDGHTLIVGQSNGRLQLWDLDDLAEGPLALDLHNMGAYALSFDRTGQHLLSGGTDGRLVLWDLDPRRWSERACVLANRNLTAEEWKQYVGDSAPRVTCPEQARSVANVSDGGKSGDHP